VVIAELVTRGESKGPHAFLMDLRVDGRLAPGVSVVDMGVKTTGNDLDNGRITFANARIPRTALLDAHCGVDARGTYTLTTPGLTPFDLIGQRLYSGRVAVAQAALAYRSELFRVTKAYADAKPIWSPHGEPRALSSIPQLAALFEEAGAKAAQLERFVNECEAKLSPLMREGQVPDATLAHMIATAKVKAVEGSIDLCWRLKQEVGSYALVGDSGFVHLDFLNCCKFAEVCARHAPSAAPRARGRSATAEWTEPALASLSAHPMHCLPRRPPRSRLWLQGDSRVLMQKMARDALRAFGKGKLAGASARELELCTQLGQAVQAAGKDKAAQAAAWDEQHALVFALAEATMERTMPSVLGPRHRLR
jgi:acyl-CoA oxidase